MLTKATKNVINADYLEPATPYLSTGSSTARNLATRGADIINVKDFGAVGDGVADDAPAIRAALAFAVTKASSTLYFPNGKYNLATFSDGSTSFVSQVESYKSIIEFNNQLNPLIKINIVGDGATITSGLWPNNQYGYGFGSGKGASFMFFFSFEGNIDLSVYGLNFISRFGGTGEKPIRNEPTNIAYAAYGQIIGIAHLGIINKINHAGASPDLINSYFKVENCNFRDFCPAIDTWCQDSLLINNCRVIATHGVSTAPSTGGGQQTVGINIHAYVKSGVITNCFYDGCESKNLTFLNAYDATINVGGVNVVYNGKRGQDGFPHTGDGEYVISNNAIYGSTIEPIKLGGANSYGTISGNFVDATQPLGSTLRPSYGITANGSNTSISGNTVINSEVGIFANQQASSGLVQNISITGNTIKYTGYATSGYFNSPYVPVPNGIQIQAAKNFIIDGNSINISNPLISADPLISAGGAAGISCFYTKENGAISNNVLKLENLRNASDKFAAIIDNGFNNYYSNNRIDGYYYCFASGGGIPNNIFGDCSLIDNNTIFNGKEYFASLDGQFRGVAANQRLFKLYPSAVGWYRLYGGSSWSGSLGVKISTPGIDNTLKLNQNVNQSTDLLLSWTGYPYGSNNYATINQLSNVFQEAGGDIVVSKVAVSGIKFGSWNTGVWLYVNQLLERFSIKITGGGGSGASATALFTNGVVTSITGLVGGSGFTSLPTCTISPIIDQYIYSDISWVTPAVLTPTISGGQITNIAITNGGTGYGACINISVKNEMFMDQGLKSGSNSIDVQKIILADNTANNPIPTENETFILPLKLGSRCVWMYDPSDNGPDARYKIGSGTPLRASGVPSSTPEFIGQDYLDTATNKFYKAKGTASSADWIALN
jgi:hypothetical protein